MNRAERRAMQRAARRAPTRHRVVRRDTMAVAMNQASCLTPAEVAQAMAPAKSAVEAMRRAQATADHWSVLVGAVCMGVAIERQGVVTGLTEQLGAADRALAAIEARATASGQWRSPTLYAQEIEAIKTLVHVHQFQVEQLSFSEFSAAYRSADQELRRSGKEVEHT